MSFQVVCAVEACKSEFVGLGHVVCRQHADCRVVKEDGEVIWTPDSCQVCLGLADTAFERPSSKSSRQRAIKSLKKWARGFQKNRPGRPFLPSEMWRARVFPKGAPEFVYRGVTCFKAVQGPAEPSPAVEQELLQPKDTFTECSSPISKEQEASLLQEGTVTDSSNEGDDSSVSEPVAEPGKEMPLVKISINVPNNEPIRPANPHNLPTPMEVVNSTPAATAREDPMTSLTEERMDRLSLVSETIPKDASVRSQLQTTLDLFVERQAKDKQAAEEKAAQLLAEKIRADIQAQELHEKSVAAALEEQNKFRARELELKEQAASRERALQEELANKERTLREETAAREKALAE